MHPVTPAARPMHANPPTSWWLAASLPQRGAVGGGLPHHSWSRVHAAKLPNFERTFRYRRKVFAPSQGEFQMTVTRRCFGVEAADVQERRVLCKSCSGCNILFKQPTWSSTFQNPHRKSSRYPVHGMIGRLLWANVFFLFLQLLNFVFIFTNIVFRNYFGFNLFFNLKQWRVFFALQFFKFMTEKYALKLLNCNNHRWSRTLKNIYACFLLMNRF